MNVYDFDETIYKRDSTEDFFYFCLKKNKKIIKYLPAFIKDVMKYSLQFIDKTHMKETFFRYLNEFKIGEIDDLVNEFWNGHKSLIYDWYLLKKKSDDVIISASPNFLLKPICDELKVYLISSNVDKNDGTYQGLNCYGEEKVNRYREIYGNITPDEFYSDSISDEPMALISKKAFRTINGKIYDWEDYKKGKRVCII